LQLQQSFTSCWRTHISGFMSLMAPHGTFGDMIEKCAPMGHSLLALMMAVLS
jgi:hypothetical protein